MKKWLAVVLFALSVLTRAMWLKSFSSHTMLAVLLFSSSCISTCSFLPRWTRTATFVHGSRVAASADRCIFVFRRSQHRTHLTEHFVVELGQGLYFVGTVLTYTLWGAMMRLREKPARLMQLVLALGIYFSARVGTYALQDLFPGRQMPAFAWVPPAARVWLSLAWGLALLRTREEASVMVPTLAVKAP